MKYTVRLLWILIFASVHSWNPVPAQATRIQLVNLEEMVRKADRIFIGVCSTVEDSTLPGTGMPVTSYTFSVTEPIKGEMGDTLTIRQLGVRKSSIQGGKIRGLLIPGMPTYQVGQEVVLFLTADSSLGLSSPVGLSQGAFSVVETEGRKIIQNGLQNAGLFKGLSPEMGVVKWKLLEGERDLLSVGRGPIDYDTFMSVVKKMLSTSSKQ